MGGGLHLCLLLLLSSRGLGEEGEGEEEDVVVLHDSWQDATDASDGSSSSSSPVMTMFTAADAVTPPEGGAPDLEAEEDPAVAAGASLPGTRHLQAPITPTWPGRALYEEGLALLASSQGDRLQGWRLIEQVRGCCTAGLGLEKNLWLLHSP